MRMIGALLLVLLAAGCAASDAEYKPSYSKDGKFNGVFRASDKAFVPNDARNPSYREFLAWNQKQATPISFADKRESAEEQGARQKLEAARAVLKALKAKPKEERTAEDVRAAVHAIIDILGED